MFETPGQRLRKDAGAIAEVRRIPKWAWAIALILASAEPLQHAWITHAPPQGTVSTGLHVADSVIFIHAMRMFESGFFNPYATGEAPDGEYSPRYFPVPFLWMYGVLGVLARLLGLSELTALGLANGAGALFFLLAAFCFLREAVPKQANLAFVLYALGGGVGGVVYVIATASGAIHHAEYEPYLMRYFLYELMEGSTFSPALFSPRLYYTVALGCALSALALLCRWARLDGRRRLLGAMLLECLATLVNLRIGTMAFGVAALFLLAQHELSLTKRLRAAGGLAASMAIGLLLVWTMVRMFPRFSQNVWDVVRGALWVSPFFTAACFHVLLAFGIICQDLRRLPRGWRVAAGGLSGYLLAFGAVWAAYQVYYGILFRCADAQAAIWASDPALLGGLVGAVLGGYLPREEAGKSLRNVPPRTEPWIMIWLLLYLAVAISAFGQGWFLSLMPQRAVIFVGLPLAILSAKQLQRMAYNRPRFVRVLITGMVVFGGCSVVVAALFFQGPLGFRSGEGVYAWAHTEVITAEDAACLGSLGAGRVLAPERRPSFPDIVTVRGNRTLGGMGGVNFATAPLLALRQDMARFFAPNASAEEREVFAHENGVEWVYCPHFPPVDEETRRQLREATWLRNVAQVGDAMLFKVVNHAATGSKP